MAEEIKKENNGSVVDFSGRYLINSNICFLFIEILMRHQKI